MTTCSVIFSFRNESGVLPELIARVAGVFRNAKVEYELIFVNDASTDSSLNVLREARQRNPRIKIINMSRRFGVSECVFAGMERASGEAVIWMDADLQDPPEVIPKMLEEWRKGAEVVHTVRTERQGESPLKMLLTRLAYRILSITPEVELPRNAGDFKLLGRRPLEHLLKMREMDPYLRGLAVWVGFRQVYVPYVREPRASGRTHFPLFGSRGPIKTFFNGLTSFSLAPIYMVMGLGAIVGLASLALFAAWVAAWLLGSRDWLWLGWLALIVMIWGTVLGSVGMVGVYVGRAYKNTRGRPRYIIQDSDGF